MPYPAERATKTSPLQQAFYTARPKGRAFSVSGEGLGVIPRHRGEQKLGARFMVKADIAEVFCVFADGAAFKQLLIPERDGDIAEEQERQTLAIGNMP